MGRKLKEFSLLLCKNFRQEYRTYIFCICEILLPLFLIGAVVIVRGISRPDLKRFHMSEPKCVIPELCDKPPEPKPEGAPPAVPISLLYTPSGNKIIGAAMETFKAGGFKEVLPFDSPSAMEEHYKTHLDQMTYGLEFPADIGTESVPQHMKVAIRLPSEFVWFTGKTHKKRTGKYARYNVLYHDTGFTMLQASITVKLINAIKAESGGSEGGPAPVMPILKSANFTSPNSLQDVVHKNQYTMAPLIMQLSFIFNCICLVKKLSTEKETRLKEAMKIMGMTNYINYITWYLKAFVMLGFIMLLVTLIITLAWCPFFTDFESETYTGKYATLFWRTDLSVVLVFLLLYACSVISFSFMMSSLFNKSSVATIGVALGWFLTITPFQLTIKEDYGPTVLYVCGLAMNSAMGYGIALMYKFEGDGMGVKWNNLNETSGPDADAKMSVLFVLLFVDSVLYMLIAIYVDTAFPGEFGVPLPWYFPFTLSYWGCTKPGDGESRKGCCGRKGTKSNQVEPATETSLKIGTTLIEPDPTDLPVGVEIKHLRKTYGKAVVVKNLNLKMYENQILVLLGHNGAGKTTTVSMLIGMFTPTSGTAVINGHDITTDIKGVRESLGYCPQYDILFDFLTVEEHLHFFGEMKGLHGKPLKSEVELYIKTLEMEDLRKTRAGVLAVGLRRKLSVGIAFSAGSKLVVLDEPTSGMDPASRRALWDIIQSQKFGRVILLITHFMDEADLLGDRVAIMAEGELQACGTSFFLKNKMKIGYHLSVTKGPTCESDKVTNLLKRHINNLQPDNNIAKQLTYVLPVDKTGVFEDMLIDLEKNSEKLDVVGYTVALPTMDQVFHKLGAYQSGKMLENLVQVDGDESSDIKCYTGCLLLCYQTLAMFMKRGLAFLRSWLWFLIIILLLIINLINVQLNIEKIDTIEEFPEQLLTIHDFGDSGAKVLIESSGNFPLLDTYKQILNDEPFEHETVPNLEEVLSDKSSDYPEKFSRKYVVAVSFSNGPNGQPMVTNWYNNNSFHSEGVALGLTLKALYKLSVEKNIEFSNKPFEFKTPMVSKFGGNQASAAAQSITVGMCFVSAFYIMFYVKERISNCKHVQLISGVRVLIFWMVSYIFDFVTFVGVTTICIISLACLKVDGMKTAGDLKHIFRTLLMYAFAQLPLVYVCSFVFSSSSLAFGVFAIGCYMFSDVFYVVVEAFKTSELMEKSGEILEKIFMAVPQYNLAVAIGNIYSKNFFHEVCQSEVRKCMLYNTNADNENQCWETACETQKEYFIDCCQERVPDIYTHHESGLWKSFMYFAIVGLALNVIIIIMDYKLLQWLCNAILTIKDKYPPDEKDESSLVKYIHRSESKASHKSMYAMKARHLAKSYGKLKAVDDVTIDVRRSECFGMLGESGAGKSTIFSMVTGKTHMKRGNSWVGGYSIRTGHRHVYEMIGYCPQYDSLLEELTVKETLIIFSLLKGVPIKHCKTVTVQAAENLNYFHHYTKVAKKLSGGTKRKLSTSVTMIGGPLMIYLDEPTSGMDPASQRYTWNALCQVRSKGSSICMTSHSMEECEAMCDRYAVVSHGHIMCAENQQALVDQYCKGYTLILKVKKDRDDAVNAERTKKVSEFIRDRFPKSELKEKYQVLLKYSVSKQVPCSTLFSELEYAKSKLLIEDYNLGEPSVEQVFLAVSKNK